MAIKVEQTRVGLLEASKHNPFASQRNTYIHTILEIDGETTILAGDHVHKIVALEWNDQGTSQLLVSDTGMKFRPGNVKILD